MDTVGIRMKSMVQALDVDGDLESVSEYVASMPRIMATTSTIEGGSVQEGQQIYQGLCVACHGPEGLGNEALRAPPLVGQPDWYLARQVQKFRMRWRGGSAEDVWGTTMQVNSLLYDDEQIKDALAYIQTLQ
jgi:cytochrome c553